MKDKDERKLSRRAFAQRAAVLSATAAVAVIPGQTLLDGTTADGAVKDERIAAAPSGEDRAARVGMPTEARGEKQEHKSALQAPPNQPKLSPESQAEADARYQQVLVVYGSRLSEEEKSTAKILCNYLQPSLDRVRSFSLDNSVAPALYLKPLVERVKKVR